MKSKSRRLLIILLLVIIAGSIVWVYRPQESVPDYVFSYAENQAENYPTTLGGKYFAQLVEERTDGRIKILVQHSGERGAESEVIDLMLV